MSDLYTSGEYLQTARCWHAEDSPWKAERILEMLRDHALQPSVIAEVGCGAGGILKALSQTAYLRAARFHGYDISPQAIELCRADAPDNIHFTCKDVLSDPAHEDFDLLLVIDVFEHVPDYLGFVERCRNAAKHKIYHIPLDLHVSALLRNSFLRGRYSLGHLHYFTADSAIATLQDTGHEIIDCRYTNGAAGLFAHNPSLKRAVANVPRWLIARASAAFAARLLGGFSLLVLAR